MPGVRIGNRCVVGVGSVVTRSIPDGTVAAGNPARAIDTYDRLVARMKAWPAASNMVGDTRRQRVDSVA